MVTEFAEVSFKTFFGDYLNGVFITWKSKPTVNTGSSDLLIDFQCNLRSRLHIFGYGSEYADAAAVLAANLLRPAWYTTDYVYDKKENFGPNTIAKDYKNGTPTSYPTVTPITGIGSTTTSDNYSVYVVWRNPNLTGAVTFDGFEAKFSWELTPPVIGSWVSKALMIAAPPVLKFKFQDNSTTGLQFD